MVNFEYLVPTKIVFGKETEKEAGRLIKEFGGHKALIPRRSTSWPPTP